MVTFPFCKINLGLNIIDKRPDGYHSIESCFYPVPWTDILEVIPSDQLKFTSSGTRIPGDPADNLCLKAYRLLKRDFNLDPVQIHLHKIIPTGAGLGGGSGDAAFTLIILNKLFSLSMSEHQMISYTTQLGSDCSFFLNDKPQIGTGRGEVLSVANVNLKGKFLVIVKPEVHVSTQEAYEGCKPKPSEVPFRQVVENIPFSQWKGVLQNDFEKTVFRKYPAIEKIKVHLYAKGATYASMSGSGSAVFGIFNKSVDLKSDFRGLTYWSGYL